MARLKALANTTDPETGKPLTPGVTCIGPSRYRARKLIDGKRQSLVHRSDLLAKQWLEDRSVETRQGTFVDRRPLEKVTVANLVQCYIDEKMQDGGARRGAREDREGHTPSILNDKKLAALKLSMLTDAEVQGFADRQAAKHAPSTVVKRLNLLATILEHAIKRWKIPLPTNPATADAVPRPEGADLKRERRLLVPSAGDHRRAAALGEGPLSAEEDDLYTVLAGSENRWDLLLTKWAIAQGTRQGEALGLRWRDVDMDRKTFKVYGRVRRGPKNQKHRTVRGPEVRPLMPGALAILQSLMCEGEPDPGSLVFPAGDHMAFRVRWGRMVAKAGARMTGARKELGYLQDLTYHDLRHEATSRLALVYTNWPDLKRVTGHRDQKSLDRYYQPDLSKLAEQAEVGLVKLRDVLVAWQAEEVTAAWAMRQTQVADVQKLLALAVQSGVEVRVAPE